MLAKADILIVGLHQAKQACQAWICDVNQPGYMSWQSF